MCREWTQVRVTIDSISPHVYYHRSGTFIIVLVVRLTLEHEQACVGLHTIVAIVSIR